MRGLKTINKYHEENTGLPYFPFKIKEGAKEKTVRVRVLAKANYDYDDGGNILNPEANVVQALFMHQKFKVLNPTRCVSDDIEPVPGACPLCRVKAPRSLRTYIPVRVRGDDNKTRVQIIEYGRDNLNEVQNFIEEYAPHGDITQIDVKIKRMGVGKDTEYRWLPAGDERELDSDELELEIPNMDEIVPIKDELELEKRAIDFERYMEAQERKERRDAEDDDDEDEEEERPARRSARSNGRRRVRDEDEELDREAVPF
jgi:hypothetical protein